MDALDELRGLVIGRSVKIVDLSENTVTLAMENGATLEIEAVCEPDCSCYHDDEEGECEVDDCDCYAMLQFYITRG